MKISLRSSARCAWSPIGSLWQPSTPSHRSRASASPPSLGRLKCASPPSLPSPSASTPRGSMPPWATAVRSPALPSCRRPRDIAAAPTESAPDHSRLGVGEGDPPPPHPVRFAHLSLRPEDLGHIVTGDSSSSRAFRCNPRHHRQRRGPLVAAGVRGRPAAVTTDNLSKRARTNAERNDLARSQLNATLDPIPAHHRTESSMHRRFRPDRRPFDCKLVTGQRRPRRLPSHH